ncbi:MAG TPA: glycosyltransferase [Pyrinomonadaceae bacterium]|jgi:glycosyltransferase involved in cell wall biosynthesis
MKVVRIIARLNVGGPARHVVWLTEALQASGHESTLIAGTVPRGEGDMSYFARAHGVEPLIIPELSREISSRDAVAVWKLYRELLRQRPDIVHTHTAKAGTVGRVAGLLYRWLVPSALYLRPRRVRFIHTYHGHIFHSYYGPLKTRLFLLVEKVLARVATDRIIVISPQQYREIHETFGVGRTCQFAVIPLGLDLEAFGDWPRRRSPLREELGATDGEVLVGIVGRLTEIKNHSLFLRAAARYKARRRARGEEGPRVRFLVIGDGHLLGQLREEARALGLGRDELVFLGQRDDAENFYPGLDIVALTSRNEGTPLTLIEAMANERAVVAVGVGGVVDLLGGEVQNAGAARREEYAVCERGVLVRRQEAEAFAAALERAIEDESLRRAMAERARLFVEREYTKERLVGDVTRLYHELLHEKDAADAPDLPPGEAATAASAARLKRRV